MGVNDLQQTEKCFNFVDFITFGSFVILYPYRHRGIIITAITLAVYRPDRSIRKGLLSGAGISRFIKKYTRR